MRAVLHASAAIEIVLGRPHAPRFTAALDEADAVMAPELYVAEVVNAVWKYHRFENMDLRSCHRALDAAIALVDILVCAKDLYGEAFLLARTTRHSTYDMFYLALARREDAVFLTLDAGLRKEGQRQGVRLEL